MATLNPFDLLGDDDNEDPTLLIAAQQQKLSHLQLTQKSSNAAPVAQLAKGGKFPSKPLPPAQAVREVMADSGRGGRGGGRGFGRGGGRGGLNRDFANGDSNGFSGGYRPSEGDSGRSFEKRGGFGGPRGSGRGGRRGGFTNGDADNGDRAPRRIHERRSGTGRGSEFKRDGAAGGGSWGHATEETHPETEDPTSVGVKNVTEKHSQEENAEADNEVTANKEEKEQEEKEMTLEEYEKVFEEKRKALTSLKNEERKVELDNDLKSMQALSNKKANIDVFIKLGSDKEKRKDVLDKDEKARKAVNINEFLKPGEGNRYFRGGRGREGRDRGFRGGYTGGNIRAPPIEDRQHFPTLGAK